MTKKEMIDFIETEFESFKNRLLSAMDNVEKKNK